MSVILSITLPQGLHRSVMTPENAVARTRGMVIDNFVLEVKDYDPRDLQTLAALMPSLLECFEHVPAAGYFVPSDTHDRP
jgi:hypothetical protein